MRLGLIARADNSGLGSQTWEFFRHMDVHKTMVVDISQFNGYRQYPERYGPEGNAAVLRVKGFPRSDIINEFLKDLDVVFIAESSYNPWLYERARELGVKTAVQYNYEFFDWFSPRMPKPDMLIAPSTWHYEDVDEWCKQNGVSHVYLHCPVDRKAVRFREIRQAKTFLHTAGRSAAHDRNGTATVIRASKFLRSDAKILVRFQGEQGLAHQATHSFEDYLRMQVEFGDPEKLSIVRYEHDNYVDAYKHGDVLLMPRRYGGNCLPVNEALSAGMPVIMPRISPNDKFLPDSWLLPAEKIDEFTPRTKIDIYDVHPETLARKIDNFAEIDEAAMLIENARASNLAESISWEWMRASYEKALGTLCNQS